jgi:hypothetical protein
MNGPGRYRAKDSIYQQKFLCLLLLACLLLSAQIGNAATYTVSNTDDSGSGSLRQAIIDANNNSGARPD